MKRICAASVVGCQEDRNKLSVLLELKTEIVKKQIQPRQSGSIKLENQTRISAGGQWL